MPDGGDHHASGEFMLDDDDGGDNPGERMTHEDKRRVGGR